MDVLSEQIDSLSKFEGDLRQNLLPQGELVPSAATLNVLKTLRDFRWYLMALRAEVEDPGDAPVFDNAGDLLAYLKIASE